MTSERVTLEASALAAAMRQAAAVVEARNTIPILANVRIEVVGDALELVTTDLDIECRRMVPLAAPGGALACTVDARRLAMLAQAVPAGAQLGMAIDETGRLLVTSGRSRWVLPVLPVTDFPTLPFEADGTALEVPGKVLAEAIARTAPSVSTEQIRYYLCGTLLDTEDGKLRFVSTDGARAFVAQTGVPLADPPEMIVPAKFMAALKGMAEAGPVGLELHRTRLRARQGDTVLTGKAIDGTFPQYRRIVPPEGTPLRVDPVLLRAALKRVGLVASKQTEVVKLALEPDRLTVSVTDPAGGTASEEVACECGDTFEVGFCARYLDQMLEVVGGDSVEIHIASPGSPALFRRVVSDAAFGVLMDYRI